MGPSGFQNLDTTFKYRVFRDPEHEFVISVGLGIECGGTGAASVGAEPFNTYTPNIYFAKGLGDLPDTLSWLRPVAITGQVGYAQSGTNVGVIAQLHFYLDDIDPRIDPRGIGKPIFGNAVQPANPFGRN